MLFALLHKQLTAQGHWIHINNCERSQYIFWSERIEQKVANVSDPFQRNSKFTATKYDALVALLNCKQRSY